MSFIDPSSSISIASLPPEDEKVKGEPSDFQTETTQEVSEKERGQVQPIQFENSQPNSNEREHKVGREFEHEVGRDVGREFECKVGREFEASETSTVFEKEVQILNGKEDKYDGMIIHSSNLPASMDAFHLSLKASLQHWKLKGKKGIWLEISKEKANFIPIAIQEGFDFHHAEKNHVMLTHWIAESPCTLPPNASHQVGIGAFILNPNGQVLAVQEKNGPLKGLDVWKLPTGLVEQSEDICDAAIREVKEETGIDSQFLHIIAFRQAHQVAFGKSDLFFVCALKPLTFDIIPQQTEIKDAKWMDWEEFLSQPFFQERDIFKTLLKLCFENSKNNYVGFQSQHFTNAYLYHSQNFNI